MNKNYIIIDGKEIYESDFTEFFPFITIIHKQSFAKIVKIIVEDFYKINPESHLYPIYMNFISLKSMKAKYIAMIIEFSETHNLEYIYFDYFTKEFEKLLNKNIKNKIKNNNIDFVDEKEFKLTFVKYCANKLFNILGILIKRGSGDKKNVIRAWCDVDETLHHAEISDSKIFVYPFGINIMRSIKFIVNCIKKKYNFQLVGVEYSFIDSLKTILFKNKVENLIKFEYNGMKKHSTRLLSFRKVFTSDEYQFASQILYSSRGNDTIVTNRAHGIGVYNLFIDYDHFEVLNNAQHKYYFKNNPNINITYPENKTYKYFNKTSTKIVYIDQGDLKEYDLNYEIKLQQKILSILRKLSSENSLEISVKFHPNRSESEKVSFKKKNSFKTIEIFNENENYLFVNLYSTSFFELHIFGKCLFVEDDLFSAKNFFGDEIDCVHINNLENKIQSYSSYD